MPLRGFAREVSVILKLGIPFRLGLARVSTAQGFPQPGYDGAKDARGCQSTLYQHAVLQVISHHAGTLTAPSRDNGASRLQKNRLEEARGRALFLTLGYRGSTEHLLDDGPPHDKLLPPWATEMAMPANFPTVLWIAVTAIGCLFPAWDYVEKSVKKRNSRGPCQALLARSSA